MYLERKAYQQLLEWKINDAPKSALLIEGARRVGKSTLAESFATQEYSSHLVIDFAKVNESVKELFVLYRNDLDTFFRYLQLAFDVRLRERDALVIFDEVQLFPPAREFIKQLVADGRFDYLETGSLISIKKNTEGILIPSEEDAIRLDPLNFDEFLDASGKGDLALAIADSFEQLKALPTTIHQQAERLWREYLLVGGMPQAVTAYLETKDFEHIDRAKRRILRLYRNDIAKHGGTNAGRIESVFNEVPGQLSRHEKKFTLSALDENARMREYGDTFFWLGDAFMCNICRNATDPDVGLALSENHASLKCYMADTGLLVTQVLANRASTPNELYRNILMEKLSVNEGMFVENAVAQQLVASGRDLFFYSRTDRANSANTMEIDFLIIREFEDAGLKPRVSPVEAKSKAHYGVKSLSKFKTKFDKKVGRQYVLHPRPLRTEGDRVFLPLYMAHLL